MFKKASTSRGFTIIEIMIVLAIAGLIILIVFLVVPTAQRNARNLERKHYVAALQASITSYRSDHGEYPTQANINEYRDYVQDQGSPGFSILTIMDANSSDHTAVPDPDEFILAQDHWCNKYGDGNNATDPIAGHGYHHGVFAVWTSLENGSGTIVYCVDNRGN